ncbi:MAG: hypothetical protein ACK5HR_06045 [Mycoplasmatales bacterium]
MYRTKLDVDEHINSELDRLIAKFEQTEEDVRTVKNIISNYARNTKQDEIIEEKFDSIITKCNNGEEHIRSKKR